MTDAAIIAASYGAEKSYTHNLDDVIDSSDAVGAWGTAKESTTELVDLSGNGNIADIHGAMPTEGFIQGRRFTANNENYLDCGNDSSLNITDEITIISIINRASDLWTSIISKGSDGNSYQLGIVTSNRLHFIITTDSKSEIKTNGCSVNKNLILICTYNGAKMKAYIDGSLIGELDKTGNIAITGTNLYIGFNSSASWFDGTCLYASILDTSWDEKEITSFVNNLARLPFWSVNYTDYPDNVAEYTDNLPYSSTVISSGTFKVDDDKLQCVSAGTMTYSASYEFDGSEYIKVEIGGVEYAGTGTITQGNTTVSVAQGSNKITIEMGTGDTIEDEIGIQFRATV